MASQYRRRSLMLNTIAKVAQGNPTIITDSSSRRLQKLNIYGQSSQDGTPSVENPIPIISKEVNEIKITGKNLANIQEFEKLYDGNTFDAHYENDKITYSGADDWSGCGIVLNQTFKKGQYSIQAKGVVMVLSNVALPSFEYNIYWNDKGYPYCYRLEQSNGKVSFNSDMPFKIGFIGGDINTGKSTVSGTMEQVQIELSSEATSYEPYKSQSITLSEPITLRGIPASSGGNVTIDGQQYISDVICEKDGVIGVIKNCYYFSPIFNNIILTQGEVIEALCTNIVDKDILETSYTQFCNKFIFKYDNGVASTFNVVNKNMYTRFAKGTITEENKIEVMQSLNTEENPLYVLGQLKEPTFEPLPEEIQTQYKALKSYYPNTVIQTGCWNEVTYSAKRGG